MPGPAGFLSEEQRRVLDSSDNRIVASALEPRPPGAICTGSQGNQRDAEESMLLRYKDSSIASHLACQIVDPGKSTLNHRDAEQGFCQN
jgi:hypothetical protein